MDDREKLVELLGRCAFEECITIEPVAESRLTDYLIAHGVTIREPGHWEGVVSTYWRWYPEGARAVNRVTYRCTRCGRGSAILENFCPSCGAPMKGESNETLV